MVGKFGWMLSGVALGALWTFVTMPTQMMSQDCQLYRVNRKVVTSYVLKPFISEPTIIHEKCAPVAAVTCPAEPAREEIKSEREEKPRKHRHYRHRRYWK